MATPSVNGVGVIRYSSGKRASLPMGRLPCAVARSMYFLHYPRAVGFFQDDIAGVLGSRWYAVDGYCRTLTQGAVVSSGGAVLALALGKSLVMQLGRCDGV